MNPAGSPRRWDCNEGDYVWVDANELDRPVHRLERRRRAAPQGVSLHGPRQVQPGPAVQLHDHEAHRLDRQRTVGQGARIAARRPGAGRRDRLSGQLSLRLASKHHPQLDDADAPDRHAVPQEDRRMGFTFGFDVDNHAINTVPKETLVRITKAEDGGLGRRGNLEAGQSGFSPGDDGPQNQRYLTAALRKCEHKRNPKKQGKVP